MTNKKILFGSLAILLVFLILWEYLYPFFSQSSLQDMANYIRSTGLFAPLVSIGLMVFQAIAAPIPSFIITGANGLVFGYVWGSIISWIGAMIGATVSFYLAKKWGFQYIEKKFKGKRLTRVLEKINGPYAFLFIFLSRILPVVSFDLISFLAGFSGIGLRTFLIATGIGMVPGTIAYTVVGRDLINIEQNQDRIFIVISVILLALFISFLIKKKFW
jgi:uncharacterized membrane protein YdjX (TVP38/TMEM64 family)